MMLIFKLNKNNEVFALLARCEESEGSPVSGCCSKNWMKRSDDKSWDPESSQSASGRWKEDQVVTSTYWSGMKRIAEFFGANEMRMMVMMSRVDEKRTSS